MDRTDAYSVSFCILNLLGEAGSPPVLGLWGVCSGQRVLPAPRPGPVLLPLACPATVRAPLFYMTQPFARCSRPVNSASACPGPVSWNPMGFENFYHSLPHGGHRKPRCGCVLFQWHFPRSFLRPAFREGRLLHNLLGAQGLYTGGPFCALKAHTNPEFSHHGSKIAKTMQCLSGL